MRKKGRLYAAFFYQKIFRNCKKNPLKNEPNRLKN